MIDARAKTVRELLNTGSDQYLIPFFQRHYSWTRREWDRLWEDVVELLQDDGQTRHFMGPLVCTPTSHMPGEVTPYQLIDGQQRLTTITILLAATKAVADAHELHDLAGEIYEDFLVHKRRKGLDRFKIVPRFGDRETLTSLIENGDEAKVERDSIIKAFRAFRGHITTLIDTSEDEPGKVLRTLMKCLTDRLAMVAIMIKDENPYSIFESLNGKGLPLEQADLIRNFIFMQVPMDQQEDFNDQVWQEFEDALSPVGVEASLSPTQFYRSYLMRNGKYSPKRLTFVEFKDQASRSSKTPQEIVTELHKFLKLQQQIATPEATGNERLRHALDLMKRLDVQTADPLLLHLLAKSEAGEMTTEDLLGSINDICSFVLRRAFCGDSTRRYGQQFVAAIRGLGSDARRSLQSYLLDQGWPDDESFTRAARVFPAYRREPAKARLILEEWERKHGHKEPVNLSLLTVEHVMPQTISGNAEGKAWQEMLGTQWERIHLERLHVLGNLTLSGYNSNLSNLRYNKKRTLLAESNLHLNRRFQDLETWDETEIYHRSDDISAFVAERWPRPAGGKPYIPSGGVRVDGQEGLLSAYWDSFAAALEEGSCGLRPQKIHGRPFIWMKSARNGFWFFAEFDLEDGLLTFGLATWGKRRNDYFRILWNALPDEVSNALCDLPDVDPNWEESLLSDESSMWVNRRVERIEDRGDWKSQHSWLALAATNWERLLTPEIKSIRLKQLKDLDEEGDTDDEADEAEQE